MRDVWLFEHTAGELYKAVEEKISYLEDWPKSVKPGTYVHGNRLLLEEYREWQMLLFQQPADGMYQLDKEDWIFFFGVIK